MTAHPDAAHPPVNARGTRLRAGNMMGPVRRRLLIAAADLAATSGTKLTMVEVADRAGIAKGTLYNHFRTKNELFQALAFAECSRVLADVDPGDLTEALSSLASAVASHPVLVALRYREPASLTSLAAAVSQVRELVEGWLGDAVPGAADLITRWLASQLLAPLPITERRQAAALLASVLAPAHA